MTPEIKQAVKSYQCPGCIFGNGLKCFEKSPDHEGCGKHRVGTFSSMGKLYLGMPKGFNRIGPLEKFMMHVFTKFNERAYDKWNIPTWKHLNKAGHTIVRGHMPRINQPFLHIYLENCIDRIQCLEISEKDINEMD